MNSSFGGPCSLKEPFRTRILDFLFLATSKSSLRVLRDLGFGVEGVGFRRMSLSFKYGVTLHHHTKPQTPNLNWALLPLGLNCLKE